MSVFESSESYRPFKYPFAVEAAKKHTIELHWAEHQVELQDDLRQYNSLNGLKTLNVSHEENKAILDFNLSLFTEMDKAVGEGYTKLLPMIGNNEIRNLLMTFAAREVVHQRSYALAAETFGFPDDSWVIFRKYVEMQDKIDLLTATDEVKTKYDAAKLLATILLGEGITLFAAFASLLNLKRHGLLIGFNDVNQWSLVDEQEHVTNNMVILSEMRKDLSYLENQLLDQEIFKLVNSFVNCEIEYVRLLYKQGNQEDLTERQLIEYVKYLGQLRLFQLGLVEYSDITDNPLPWMEWLLTGKKHDNFFEKRVTDYSHKGLSGGVDYSKYK